MQTSKRIARPIRVPTDYEKLAYVDEKGELICIKDVDDEVGKTPSGEPVHLKLTAGKRTDFNPKTVAILETIYKHISKGEQVIHVSARHGMTDEVEKRLGECGVKTSRIDGSVKDHALEAAKFKRGGFRNLSPEP